MRNNTALLMIWTEDGPIDMPAKITEALVWGISSQTWYHWNGSVLKHYGKVRVKFDKPLKPASKPLLKPPPLPPTPPNMIEKVEVVEKETRGTRGTLINYEEVPAEVATDPEECEESERDADNIDGAYDDIFKFKETDEDKKS